MSKVDIILPTYNGLVFLDKAINSVKKQTFTDWILWIIDDASKEDIFSLVNKYSKEDSRIRYVRNEKNLGLQKTLNKGLQLAESKYIARIDDDDEWLDKDKLKKQIEFLENNDGYILVGTGMIAVDDNEKEFYKLIPSESDESIRKNILFRSSFIHSSVVFRRDIAKQVGDYDEGLEIKHAEDHDFWLKLGLVGKFANIPIYGVKCRLRTKSISGKNIVEQQKKAIFLIKKYKNKYPNFFKAITLAYLRMFVRLIIGNRQIHQKIKKIYSNN